MSPVSRGLRPLHRATAGQEDRVRPGQYVTDGFPVLSAGPTPHTPLEQWTFSITQGGQTRKSWTWQELRALPAESTAVDIHCVTRWPKLDTVWRGLSVDTLVNQVQHDLPADIDHRHIAVQPTRTGDPDVRVLLTTHRTRRHGRVAA